MEAENSSVVEHYTRNNLMERIRGALAKAGHDPDKISTAILSDLDHLHGGGFASTRTQVEIAEIPKGCHVLDAGCGIGGPSRYLADTHQCDVRAIDLTPEYVAVARQLNKLVGLADKISVEVGSVTQLPYEDQVFDAVLCQNVSMNVADKSAMFAQAFRVLKPGGIYTISHLANGPVAPPIYPLPWARHPELSFLETPEKIRQTLEAAGFTCIEDRALLAHQKAASPPPPGAIGGAAAMGDDMPQRIQNTIQSIQENKLTAMLIVARRPS